jgi:hypothetical protein
MFFRFGFATIGAQFATRTKNRSLCCFNGVLWIGHNKKRPFFGETPTGLTTFVSQPQKGKCPNTFHLDDMVDLAVYATGVPGAMKGGPAKD